MSLDELNIIIKHQEDLIHSGIDRDMIQKSGIYSISDPAKIKEVMGYRPDIKSLLAFPYPGTDDFIRYKIFPPLEKKDSKGKIKKQKYYQKKGSGNHLYFPPGFNKDGDIIRITEGEKKALKGTQEGLNVIGLGGIWNFGIKNEEGQSQLISDFGNIDWKNRKVEIVPDADFINKKMVNWAVFRLSNILEKQGASVEIVILPNIKGVDKLDGYLCKNTAENFNKLNRITIKDNTFNIARIGEDNSECKNIIDQIVRLCKLNSIKYFLDYEDNVFIMFKNGEHYEYYNIKDKKTCMWLQKLYYSHSRKAIRRDTINDVIDNVEAYIRYEVGEKIKLHKRVYEKDNVVYYDLSNENWETVKIDENGWEIIRNTPVFFKKYPHQQAQIIPAKEFSEMKVFLPLIRAIKNEDHKLLVVVWLIMCFIPGFSHFILIIQGTQGGGKSILTKWLKKISDPSQIDTMGLIRNTDNLIQVLDHHHVVGFDNLSRLNNDTQDILCRAVSGSAQVKRKLYTDDGDKILKLRNCIILNGINIPGTNADLLDRAIIIRTERFNNDNKIKKEDELASEFNEIMPKILGNIFSVISKVLKIKNTIEIDKLPRMANAFEYGCLIAEALGEGKEKFINAYYKNISFHRDEIVNDNLVARAVISFMKKIDVEWNGTPSELLVELKKEISVDEVKQKNWPKAANALTRKLNELKPVLEDASIFFTTSLSGIRTIRLFTSKDMKDTVQTVNNVLNTVSANSNEETVYDTLDDKDDVDGILPDLEKKNKDFIEI